MSHMEKITYLRSRGKINKIKWHIIKSMTRFGFIILFYSAVCSMVWSMDHYVCEDANGNNSGSDWINAYLDLPVQLIRGDTYYIADGNYCPNGYLFDDPVDGDKYIKILKATGEAHGTNTGWLAEYGDGQAIFTETLDFRVSYIVFDGVVGGTPIEGSLFPDTQVYGFSVIPNGIHGQRSDLIRAPWSADIDYIQISHCLLIQSGEDFDDGLYYQTCIYVGLTYANDHFLISNNYMSNAATLLVLYQSSNTTVENNYFMSNWTSPECHGQLIAPGWNSDNVIFRNNVFYHPGVFVFGTHGFNGGGDENTRNGISTGWQVYNNIVIGDGGDNVVTAGFANADSAYSNYFLDCDFHHNIFYNLDVDRGTVFIGLVTPESLESGKSRVYNNIFYKVNHVDLSGIGYTPGTMIHGYNDYYDCSGRMFPGATDNVYTGIDPFEDSTNFNFKLKDHTTPGNVLSSPYDIDYAGKIRANWDRGVYEFISTANQPIEITPISPFTKYEGEQIQFDITVTDADIGDMITLSASGLPANAILTQTEPRTWQFSWQTDFDSAGTYTPVFTANDGTVDSIPLDMQITIQNVSTDISLNNKPDWFHEGD